MTDRSEVSEVQVPTLVTPRLLLRQWHDEDLAPYAALNQDPVVMEHFPGPASYDESRGLVDRHRALLDAGEPGLYAAERRDTRAFIGFIGLVQQTFEAAFTPCVEVGWRLARDAWGQGFATEGAEACLAHAFTVLDLPEVVSMTAVRNHRSRAVMERLGMHTDPSDDFEHPRVPEGSAVRPHVLYRITVAEWRGRHRDAVD